MDATDRLFYAYDADSLEEVPLDKFSPGFNDQITDATYWNGRNMRRYSRMRYAFSYRRQRLPYIKRVLISQLTWLIPSLVGVYSESRYLVR